MSAVINKALLIILKSNILYRYPLH
uniref:Uncharacterized protein n=1 Tax=Anguilla anguilla TaxID=7936 RepID=A0A0E9V8P4_ANGAN